MHMSFFSIQSYAIAQFKAYVNSLPDCNNTSYLLYAAKKQLTWITCIILHDNKPGVLTLHIHREDDNIKKTNNQMLHLHTLTTLQHCNKINYMVTQSDKSNDSLTGKCTSFCFIVYVFFDTKPLYHYCTKYKQHVCIILQILLTIIKSATATI